MEFVSKNNIKKLISGGEFSRPGAAIYMENTVDFHRFYFSKNTSFSDACLIVMISSKIENTRFSLYRVQKSNIFIIFRSKWECTISHFSRDREQKQGNLSYQKRAQKSEGSGNPLPNIYIDVYIYI